VRRSYLSSGRLATKCEASGQLLSLNPGSPNAIRPLYLCLEPGFLARAPDSNSVLLAQRWKLDREPGCRDGRYEDELVLSFNRRATPIPEVQLFRTAVYESSQPQYIEELSDVLDSDFTASTLSLTPTLGQWSAT
jgi:hypothetical protein